MSRSEALCCPGVKANEGKSQTSLPPVRQPHQSQRVTLVSGARKTCKEAILIKVRSMFFDLIHWFWLTRSLSLSDQLIMAETQSLLTLPGRLVENLSDCEEE